MNIKCEVCGNSNIVKQDGVFVCQNCGIKYTIDEIKKLAISDELPVENAKDTETITVEGFECPKCGSNTFDKDFVRMNLFVCAGTRANGMPCNWLVCVYCETCGQHYTHENFIRQNGQYVCGVCGHPHRQFSDYMRLVAKQYYETASPEEKCLLQIKQEAESFAGRMRRESML